MARTLTIYEQETIINFNKAEDMAHIFTYEKAWQKHLEKRLGLKLLYDNGFGTKEYELPKSRIKPPKVSRKLSAETRANLAGRAKSIHQKRNLSAETSITTVKFDTENENKGRIMSRVK